MRRLLHMMLQAVDRRRGDRADRCSAARAHRHPHHPAQRHPRQARLDQRVTQVAMEATGSYWKPVWHVLEAAEGYELLLCNRRHVKNLPGRKTDVSDAAWLAQLLDCGLLRGSFVPTPVMARLRDLTRDATRLTEERTREIQRVQRVLEDAGIKLDSVASDVLGTSAPGDARGAHRRRTRSGRAGRLCDDSDAGEDPRASAGAGGRVQRSPCAAAAHGAGPHRPPVRRDRQARGSGGGRGRPFFPGD
jgi:transposase